MKFKVEGCCSLGIGEFVAEVKDGIVDIPAEVLVHSEWPRFYAELLQSPEIKIEPCAEEKAPEDDPEKIESDALKAALKAAGVQFGGNSGIKKLRELAEANGVSI